MKKARTRRVGVRLIGVSVTNFSPFNEQEYLFEDYEVKRKKMLRAVTRVRDKFGYEFIMDWICKTWKEIIIRQKNFFKAV
jgi:hypothetical protein